MLEQAADDLNLLAAFLARRGVRSPDEAAADATLVLGNSLPATIDAIPSTGWVVFSGGSGHSTDDLRDAVRPFGIATEGRSEAEMLFDLAVRRGFDPSRGLLETKSTNSGENVRFSRRLLESKGIRVRRVLVVQDPTMQYRAYATCQKVWEDEPEVEIVSFAPFVPFVVAEGGALRLECPGVGGLWKFERFVSLVLGEIPRLRDYGPTGAGFIARVDLPEPVVAAHERFSRFVGLTNR